MRVVLVLAAMLAATSAAVPAWGTHGPIVLLSVDDGDFFYRPPDPAPCAGTTDNHVGNVALRHWHNGNPLVNTGGGFGCLGGPKFWVLTATAGHSLRGVGTLRYTWDQNVPGGGNGNEVHLHAFPVVGGIKAPVPAWSTLLEGPKPVSGANPVQTHTIDFTLPAGTYRLEENVWSGSHTAWLTKLTVTEV